MPVPHIIIYTEKITPRVTYSVKLVMETLLGISYTITDSANDYKQSVSPRINYSGKALSDEIVIEPHTLLFEKDIKQYNISVSDYSHSKIFFCSKDNSSFPFDIFAAAFFLVTRYEEYRVSLFDDYKRFQLTESLAYKNNFLEEPVVDTWALMLKEALSRKYPLLIFPGKQYTFLPTIDIDNAWAFLNKSFARGFASTVKSALRLDASVISDRVKVLMGKEKDPYDTYDYIEKIHALYNLRPVIFFLLGKYGKYDKNISPDNKNLRLLVQRMCSAYPVGIHPSFQSNKSEDILRRETETLASITGEPVTRSRQHFLKLSFPDTYRNLIKSGIREDYTMGYAQLPGFRAGICTPYPFYDLPEEKETNLMVYPFQVMETTFRDYLVHSPLETIEEIKLIIDKIRKVNGTFISLWHNESLGNKWRWKGWGTVYENMIRHAT